MVFGLEYRVPSDRVRACRLFFFDSFLWRDVMDHCPYDTLFAYARIIRGIADGTLLPEVESLAVSHITSAIQRRDLDPYIALAVFLDPESIL